MADTLSRLEIGDMIPPELYEVVAEILVFVDAMEFPHVRNIPVFQASHCGMEGLWREAGRGEKRKNRKRRSRR